MAGLDESALIPPATDETQNARALGASGERQRTDATMPGSNSQALSVTWVPRCVADPFARMTCSRVDSDTARLHRTPTGHGVVDDRATPARQCQGRTGTCSKPAMGCTDRCRTVTGGRNVTANRSIDRERYDER